MDFQKVSSYFSEIVFLYICTLSEFISSYDFRLFETEIVTKQKEESLEKEVVELKARLRDLEDKLKKSENRSFEMLGTVQRLNSRPVLSDSETDDVAIEKRNAGKSQVETEDSDPLFPDNPYLDLLYRPHTYLDSNPGEPPRLVPSTERVRLRGYA